MQISSAWSATRPPSRREDVFQHSRWLHALLLRNRACMRLWHRKIIESEIDDWLRGNDELLTILRRAKSCSQVLHLCLCISDLALAIFMRFFCNHVLRICRLMLMGCWLGCMYIGASLCQGLCRDVMRLL